MKRFLLSFFLIIVLTFLVFDFVSVPALADAAACKSEGCKCSCSGTDCNCNASSGSCYCHCDVGGESECGDPE